MTIRTRTDFLVVHVSATRPSQDYGAVEIDRMHRAKGWAGIGYHFVIRRNGKVETGRAVNQVGAHVEGWNSISLGICMIGGISEAGQPEDNATQAQKLALQQLLRMLAERYPHARILGHRDLSPDKDHDGVIEPHEHIKACPCFDAIPWAHDAGLPAASIRGVWDTAAPPAETLNPPDQRNTYLQRLLARAGYAFGPIDGIVGKRTKAAIGVFQQWEGLGVTKEFDAATVAVLRARFEGPAAKAA
jgi:N-acetyl-anhydromuramyl-L-alanine amidase AmpD